MTRVLSILACSLLLAACGQTATVVPYTVEPDADRGQTGPGSGGRDLGFDDIGEPDEDAAGEDADPDTGQDIDSPDLEDDASTDPADTVDEAGDADADVDTAETTDADTLEEVAPDVESEVIERPPNCGNGTVDPGEECDDGNELDTDECTNICRTAVCGDGIVNVTFGAEIFVDPVVTNLSGQTGRVCDDGATCPTDTGCNVREDDRAPEHGICQALGFEFATDVLWTSSEANTEVTPVVRVLDWWCFDWFCREGDYAGDTNPCFEWEMLDRITCEGLTGEECDEGRDNADEADACRTDCTLPRCGDGIVDTDEECDDDNRVADDACSNECREAYCGDGIRQLTEECDDGNDDEGDGCTSECIATVPPCVDHNIGSATGASVLTGSTSGSASTYAGTCGFSAGGPDVTVGWVAPRTGSFTFDLNGSSYDTVLHLHDADCTGPELACDDDGGDGFQSSITYSVTAGQIVVIIVDGFGSGSSGSFVLNIR